MPKRKQPRKHRNGPRSARAGGRRRPPDLLEQVAASLDTGHPVELLSLASGFLSTTDPRSIPPLDQDAHAALPPRDELLHALEQLPLVESAALLTAVAGLTGDRLLRARVTRDATARGQVLPRWLAELDQARAHRRVVEFAHVLGDGGSLILGVALVGGAELAASVYIDHNLGSVVKDALVVPGALPALVELMSDTADDPDVSITDLDPADARARATEAIEHGARLFPPLETDTWPACRPLVEWALGLLPAGGRVGHRPEWTVADRHALAARFLASRFAAGLQDADSRELLDDVLWFGTDHGPGDPLRWSPVAVEMLLADWIPRTIVADVRTLAKAPTVLRALIRFSHAERGIRPELTAETLAAVDAFEPEYQDTIRSPRLPGPEALLAAMGALDPEERLAALTRDELIRTIGGTDALAELDVVPLPDEPFARDRVPAYLRDRVGEVVDLADRCCDALLSVEHRTATRRLLAAAAEGDPHVFRRGRADTLAAAACWLVVKANGRPAVLLKDLMAHFGLTGSPHQRCSALLRAIGADPVDPVLGSPRYLTAERRKQLITTRDALTS